MIVRFDTFLSFVDKQLFVPKELEKKNQALFLSRECNQKKLTKHDSPLSLYFFHEHPERK